MKRTSHLFLLVPSLFLLASCQTTPKVDTITEEEAKEFIKTHYNDKIITDFTDPTDATTFSWEIVDTKDETGINEAKDTIKTYLGKDVTDLKKNGEKIVEGKGIDYLKCLTDYQFDNPIGDAVIGMNWKTIYPKFYQSKQNDDDHDLIYKKGPNNGLIIISQYMGSKAVHTRTHTYDNEGLEKKFEVVCSTNDSKTQFKMTIDFHY